MRDFSAKKCVDNIYALCKFNNIKIGDLEAKCNVSPGYFSRLNKNEEFSFPNIDVLLRVSSIFNVGLDSIVHFDYGSDKETEAYIISFINKINRKTNDGTIRWSKTLLSSVNHSSLEYSWIKAQLKIATMDYYYSAEIEECNSIEEILIISSRYNSLSVQPQNIITLAVRSTHEFSKVCEINNYEDSELNVYIKQLIQEVSNSIKRIYIEPKVKESIDDFMNNF